MPWLMLLDIEYGINLLKLAVAIEYLFNFASAFERLKVCVHPFCSLISAVITYVEGNSYNVTFSGIKINSRCLVI